MLNELHQTRLAGRTAATRVRVAGPDTLGPPKKHRPNRIATAEDWHQDESTGTECGATLSEGDERTSTPGIAIVPDAIPDSLGRDIQSRRDVIDDSLLAGEGREGQCR